MSLAAERNHVEWSEAREFHASAYIAALKAQQAWRAYLVAEQLWMAE